MISRLDSAVAGVIVHIHARMISHAAEVVSRISDLKGKPPVLEFTERAVLAVGVSEMLEHEADHGEGDRGLSGSLPPQTPSETST